MTTSLPTISTSDDRDLGSTAVAVAGLVKTYPDPEGGTFNAVDGLSFDVARGEVKRRTASAKPTESDNVTMRRSALPLHVRKRFIGGAHARDGAAVRRDVHRVEVVSRVVAVGPPVPVLVGGDA